MTPDSGFPLATGPMPECHHLTYITFLAWWGPATSPPLFPYLALVFTMFLSHPTQCPRGFPPGTHLAHSASISFFLGIPSARPQVLSSTSASRGYFRFTCKARLPGFLFFSFLASYPWLPPYSSQPQGLTMALLLQWFSTAS